MSDSAHRLATGALRCAAAVACALSACAAAAGDARLPQAPQRWMPAELSSPLYESSPTFSEDGRELYFFRADRSFRSYRLLQSRCIAGRWTAPRPPPFAAAAGVSEADPWLSPDGRRLYYVSARAARDGEDLDIWRVTRTPGGVWSKPERLPAPVNSSASELLPRELPDGRLLFGSARPGGYGQGDIYFATPLPSGGWRVDNVGPPISTAGNEYEAEVSRDGRVMVVVADRGTRSHLYVFDRRGTRWVERGRVAARDDVFQVGPLLSPRGDRLLFAQADGARSGEWFMVDLAPAAARAWPPRCAPPAE